MVKKNATQLATSADRGGEGGEDRVSIIVQEEEDGDDGDGVIMAEEDNDFKSSCSRKLLKKDFLKIKHFQFLIILPVTKTFRIVSSNK